MVANVEVAVGIVSPARCVHYSFSLPVSVTVILNSVVDQGQKMSGYVDSVICMSGQAENVGAAVDIASSSYAVQKLLALLPFLRQPSWISRKRRSRIFSTIEPLISPYPKWGGG